MRWFPTRQRRRDRFTGRRVARADTTFLDGDGRKWNVCVFRRSSVGAWWSEEDWDWSRKLVVVFERHGEERVAVTDTDHDLNAPGSLARLFAEAGERRSGQDRRASPLVVPIERREEPDRRTGWDRTNR